MTVERDAGPEEEDEDEFAVWPENYATLRAFLKLARKWRFDDYPAVESVMRIVGVKNRQMAFDDLLAMESAAREIAGKNQ